MQNAPIQIYKKFSKDLNSIYIYRENSDVKFNNKEGKLSVNGTLSLLNCSNEPQKFHIKVKVPKHAIDYCKFEYDYVTINNEFFINPQEEKFIDIHEELKSDINDKYMSGQFSAFEYILYNDESQVIFKGEDYRYQQEMQDMVMQKERLK